MRRKYNYHVIGAGLCIFIVSIVLLLVASITEPDMPPPITIKVILLGPKASIQFHGEDPKYINGGVKFKEETTGKDIFIGGGPIVVVEKHEDLDIKIEVRPQNKKEKILEDRGT